MKSDRLRCSRKKAGTSICLDRSVEDRYVAASASDQLSAFNSRENCKCVALNRLGIPSVFPERQNLTKPVDVYLGEAIDFYPNFGGKVMVLCRHDAAKTHSIVFHEC